MKNFFTSTFQWFDGLKMFARVLLFALVIAGITVGTAEAQEITQQQVSFEDLDVGSVVISVGEVQQQHWRPSISMLTPQEEEALVVPLSPEQFDDLRERLSRMRSIRPEGAEGLELVSVAASAPNAFSSPSWARHAEFAQFLMLYLPGEGVLSPALNPTAYRPLQGLYTPCDASVTSFNSWRCVENPGTPFGGEFGNRLHIGLRVEGDCMMQFTLTDVNYAFSSTDGSLNSFGDLSGTTLNGTTRVGIACGPDGVLHTPDDIIFASGEPDTTLMDALVYAPGFGSGWWPGGPGDPLDGQEAIDALFDYVLDEGVHIEAGYSVFTYATGVVLLPAIFHDGFETGDASAWSAAVN